MGMLVFQGLPTEDRSNDGYVARHGTLGQNPLEKKNKMTGLGNFESLRFNFDMVIFRNCQIPSLSQS